MEGIKYFSFSTQRKFGAEFEVTAHMDKAKLRDCIAAIDPNHQIKISEYNEKDYGNNHWSVKRDGSCKDKDFPYGFEIASFVGSGMDDITLINGVVTKLRDAGVKVNDNCAIHVHAEVADFSKYQLAKTVAIWMKVENILLQMVPKRRRESIYCVPLRRHYKALSPDKLVFAGKEDQGKFFAKIRPDSHSDHNRRVTLNICNVCSALGAGDDYYDDYYGKAKYKKRMTMELRLPEGSVNPRDAANWIKMFVRFVALSQHRKFPDDLASVGLKETLRFMGLHEPDGTPFILSRGLWNLKVWFLERILAFTDDKELREEAWSMLEYITTPYKTYDQKEFKKVKNEPKELVGSGKYGGIGFGIAGNDEPWMDLIPADLD